MSKTDDSSAADRGSELTDRLGPLVAILWCARRGQ